MAASATAPSTMSADHPLYEVFPHLKLLEKSPQNEIVLSPTRLKKSETILLYFSAHWCPPCQQFTPVLSAVTSPNPAAPPTPTKAFPPGAVRVVFVSRDKSEAEFVSYFRSMGLDFLAVDFTCGLRGCGLRDQMCVKYKVQGIPHLACVNSLSALAEPAAFDSSQLVQEMMQIQAGGSVPSMVLGRIRERCGGGFRMEVGTKVRLVLLKSKPELNGRAARVVGWRASERYLVKVEEEVDLFVLCLFS